jgi:3-hydroxyacyl-CoA dehydrogenase
MSGLDIAYANIKRQNPSADSNARHVPLVERLVGDHKRLGRKTDAGWYDYGADGRPVASDLVAGEVLRASAEMKLTRRTFQADEIVARITLAIIAEACAILDEGIAETPRDIDLVLVHGYGFPRWRGGLMHYADSCGLNDLVARYAALAEADPLSWAVPPLLSRLVAEGIDLDGLNAAKSSG